MNRKQNIVFNLLVAFVFSVIMGFFMTWIGGGLPPLDPAFISVYLRGTAIGFSLSLPLSFLFLPIIRKWVLKAIS